MALVLETIQTEGIAALSYLLGDDQAGVAAVVDPRADVDCYLTLARERQVSITHIFETHNTIAGGAMAALTGGEFANEWLPSMWQERFGDSVALRAVVAVSGGILMAFGARLAGGCTGGHGISGTLQPNVASWISVLCFFIDGIAVAKPLFSR